jgi:nucleoside-diphosphate-sugar epimerase
MMRLLLTGASGFIGRNVLLALPHTWEIVAVYRSENADFLRFIQVHQLNHVRSIACDLTDAHQVSRTINLIGRDFESCLALASNTSIPGSIEQPLQDLRTNTVGLLHLLQCCTFEHLVYLSSGAVYIGLQGLVGPTSAVSPTLPYAISKLAAELYIRAFVERRETLRWATIIRFFGAYGPYEPSRKLYTKLVRQFAFERNPHFTITGDGENYIDAMYIDDAIRALMTVLTQPPIQKVQCIDLGTGSHETVNQMVTRAAHTFGLEPQLHHHDSTAEYIQFAIDPRPFALTYQFTPSISLEVGLQRLAAHLMQEESTVYERA